MILKKPYAILIKYFRLIHIILTVLSVFIALSLRKLVHFFQTFIANNYSITITPNLVSDTISPFLYIAIIISLIILGAVYILLQVKKKPNKLYLVISGYYIILLIGIIISAILINGLSVSLWETASARMYRDLSGIIYYPIYIIVIILITRSLGFNVKQFNFKDDLKELEITEADSEEIELNLNFQTYKFLRFLRRLKREFKYYYLENKFVIYIIGAAVALVIGYIGLTNYEKIKYTYRENHSFSYNSFTLDVLESMITNVDSGGDIIYDDKYFVVIKLQITNSSSEAKYLDYDNLKLYYGKDYVYPTLDLGSKFVDFGDPFMNDQIKAGATKTYIIPYMIDKKYQNKNFKLLLYTGASFKSKEFIAKTTSVTLKPTEYSEVNFKKNASLGDTISLSSSLLQDSKVMFANALTDTRYEYSYKSCYQDACRDYKDVVVADSSYQSKQALIVLDYSLAFDKSSASYENIFDAKTFANNFLKVEYNENGSLKRSNVKYVTPQKLSDKMVLQTTGNILNSDILNLIITVRNKEYSVNIKGT